ncbi:40S ribosomal protein S29 [Phytophthora megakarya]|uniref:40S ribosomal protein S29 n=1 Tax=Phytophthora megakarya TaxID=4795 RepID=A0A225WY14_9STRA|nr:40S ribosomal protein S29 [Phytophthora megakarya]
MANLTYSHPRTYGKDSRHCRVCKTTRGLIRKYHLNMCRRCFRERATDIGFVKVTAIGGSQSQELQRLTLVVFCSTGKLLLVGQPPRWTTGRCARDTSRSLTLKPATARAMERGCLDTPKDTSV